MRPLILYKKGDDVDVLGELLVDLESEIGRFDHSIPMDAANNQLCEFTVDIDVGSYIDSMMRKDSTVTEAHCQSVVERVIYKYLRDSKHNDVFRVTGLRTTVVHGSEEEGCSPSETITLWIADYASIDGGYDDGSEFMREIRRKHGSDFLFFHELPPIVDQPSPSIAHTPPHEKIVEETVYGVSKAIVAAAESLQSQNPEMSAEDCKWIITEQMKKEIVSKLSSWSRPA